jgi:acetolactate synthase-1/2/3 large subunit
MGDGSYIFSNSVACHQIAEALGLPILVLVLNNGGYGAVEKSVVDHYPAGHAATADRVPLTRIEPVPDFTMIASASRAYAARVDRASDLPEALDAALAHVRQRRQQALLEITIA